MTRQYPAAKRRSALTNLGLGLAIMGGLLSPVQTLATDLQTSANASQTNHENSQRIAAGHSQANARVATPEEILTELNRVRQSPAEYAAWLETLRPYYDGNDFRFPGEPGIRTSEGVAALDAAIYSLSARSPMPPLTLAPGLISSTQDHLEELLTYNRFTLSGIDGSTPVERAEQYGSLEGRLIELLSERYSSAEAIVAALIINDGNRGRSTQEILLSSEVDSVGTACGVAASVPLCVFDYASSYVSYADGSIAGNSGVPDSRSARAGSVDDPTWFGALSDSQLAILSEELIAETNRMRANPAAYAEKLEALREYYDGNLIKVPGRPAVQVVEGVSALDEAIAVLRSSEPLGALAFSPGMSFGANDHAQDLGGKGITGHYGSDGSDPFARMNRYGQWSKSAGENISYGQATIAEWHLINLLVDDNVPDRGHRAALLEPSYQAMGAACHPHAGFRIVCVMNYASDYQDSNSH